MAPVDEPEDAEADDQEAGADPYRPPVLARSNECAGMLAQISAIEKLRQPSATHRWLSGSAVKEPDAWAVPARSLALAS